MIFIALGANQSATYHGETLNPKQTFLCVIEVLNASDIKVVGVSGLWQSPAWPDPDAQPSYKNAVITVETALSPAKLLVFLKNLEQEFGRKPVARKPMARNAPRPLDLDIIDYNGEILNTDSLTLPHPRMYERGFVLFPMQEIAPNWHDPIKNRAIMDWIARLSLSDTYGLECLGRFN